MYSKSSSTVNVWTRVIKKEVYQLDFILLYFYNCQDKLANSELESD